MTFASDNQHKNMRATNQIKMVTGQQQHTQNMFVLGFFNYSCVPLCSNIMVYAAGAIKRK